MSEWQSMQSAPKNGTVIELECRHGYPWWRGLFKYNGQDEEGYERWDNVKKPGSGAATYLGNFYWRSHRGNISDWRNPYDGFDSFDFYRGKRPWIALALAELRYRFAKEPTP